MYSNRQSVMYCWRRRLVRVTRSQSERRLRNRCKRRRSESNRAPTRSVGRSKPAVAVVLLPNEGLPRGALAYGRPYRQSPTVDWPLCLGETLAPFTSQSPGIATLGPSCTPSRQLGMLFQKALNEVSSRRCSLHQVNSLGCSPDGQLSVYCDLPTKE